MYALHVPGYDPVNVVSDERRQKMIIQRITFPVKVGCRDEFIKLTKAVVAEMGLTPRVCSYRFGPYDVVISDLVFETEEDRQKFWAEVDWSTPKAVEWVKRGHELREFGTTTELLQVH